MSDRYTEFQSKLSELIEEYWDELGPNMMVDPIEDDAEFIEMAGRCQPHAWVLLGEAQPLTPEARDASFLFTAMSPMTSPMHAQGIAGDYLKY